MILDSIDKSKDYEKLHPSFPVAFEYLKSIDLANPTLGKVELDGKNLFVMISESNLKAEEDAKLEVHDKYIDIQVPVSKSEGFGWKPRTELKKDSSPFNEERDIQFFDDEPSTYFDVQPGQFVIFFPQDAHAPCIGVDTIIKIVVKIKVNS